MVRIPHVGLIALGGALGAVTRWGVIEGLGAANATSAVLLLNVCGSAIVGYLAGLGLAPSGDRRHSAWLFAAIGYAGALTTFATFALQIAEHLEAGRPSGALGITLGTTLLALGAVTFGFGTGRRVGSP